MNSSILMTNWCWSASSIPTLQQRLVESLADGLLVRRRVHREVGLLANFPQRAIHLVLHRTLSWGHKIEHVGMETNEVPAHAIAMTKSPPLVLGPRRSIVQSPAKLSENVLQRCTHDVSPWPDRNHWTPGCQSPTMVVQLDKQFSFLASNRS